MSFLQTVDFYGSRLTFLYKGNSKYTTIFGGSMTIITLFLILICCFIFGVDVVFKKNPSVTMSSFTTDHNIDVNFKKAKIFLPWRIENGQGKKVNFEKYLFPRIVYYVSSREGNQDYNDGQEIILNYTKCNRETLNQTNLEMGEYYCSDWNDVEMGGSWEGNFINYIRLELFLCENGEPYSSTANCTDIDMLSSIFNREDPWFFLIYHPTFEFNPSNLNEPLKIIYKSYFYSLSNLLVKIDRFYFTETILQDDQGWLFNEPRNSTVWSLNKIWSDYSLYKEETDSQEGRSSLIYSLYLYVSNDKVYHTRYYAKIQSVFAIIAVFERIIYLVSKVIVGYFVFYMKEAQFMDQCFECLDHSKDVMKNNYTSPGKTQTKTDLKGMNNLSNLNFLSHLNYSNDLNKKKTISTLTFDNIPVKKTKIFDEKIFKLKNILFIQLNKIGKMICGLRYKEKSDIYSRTKYYNKASLLLDKKLDIVEYLKNLNECHLMKKVIFNPIQRVGLMLCRKIDLGDDVEIDEELKIINEEKKEKLVDYFINSFRHNEISPIDQQVFSFLNKDLQKQITEVKVTKPSISYTELK